MKSPRSRYVVVMICIVLALAPAFGPWSQADEMLRQRVDRLVQPYVKADVTVGMTIGVLHHDQQEIFGYGHLGKDDQRVPDGDTVYEIGSVSKVFTGVLLGDAVARGRVTLAQAAGELLPPGVTMPEHAKRAIALQDLSTHVSGLPRMPSNFKNVDPSNPYANYTDEDLYAFLHAHKLRRAPGEQWEYSNLAAGLLGQLLAREQDSTYEKLLVERIVTPLGMTNTSITLNARQTSKLAKPHLPGGHPAANWDFPALPGAGAIRSTVHDMLRFAKANLAPPEGEIGEALELAWKVHQQPLASNGSPSGLGWQATRKGDMRTHGGQTGGYHSLIMVNRELESAVVLLANTATGEVDALGRDIMRMLGGADVKPKKFPKRIVVAQEVMQRYVGTYELAPGFVFTVTVEDGDLMVGLTGQRSVQVFPRSPTIWFYKVVPATLTFEVDDDGECISVVLFQNGAKQKAKRR